MGTARTQHERDETEWSTEELGEIRARLVAMREEILERSSHRMSAALDTETHLPDENDEASNVVAQDFELRLADKDRKLLGLVEHALEKLRQGEYGFCEGTGEPIPKARLLLRPWARYSVEYQDKIELDRRLTHT